MRRERNVRLAVHGFSPWVGESRLNSWSDMSGGGNLLSACLLPSRNPYLQETNEEEAERVLDRGERCGSWGEVGVGWRPRTRWASRCWCWCWCCKHFIQFWAWKKVKWFVLSWRLWLGGWEFVSVNPRKLPRLGHWASQRQQVIQSNNNILKLHISTFIYDVLGRQLDGMGRLAATTSVSFARSLLLLDLTIIQTYWKI